MAEKVKVTLDIDAQIKAQQSSLKSIQAELNKLHLPTGLKDSLTNTILDYQKDLEKLSSKTEGGVLNPVDEKEVTASFERIGKFYQNLIKKLNAEGYKTSVLEEDYKAIKGLADGEKKYNQEVKSAQTELVKRQKTLNDINNKITNSKNRAEDLKKVEQEQVKVVDNKQKEYDEVSSDLTNQISLLEEQKKKQKEIEDSITKQKEAYKKDKGSLRGWNFTADGRSSAATLSSNAAEQAKIQQKANELTEKAVQLARELEIENGNLEQAKKNATAAERDYNKVAEGSQTNIKNATDAITEQQQVLSTLSTETLNNVKQALLELDIDWNQYGVDLSTINSVEDLKKAFDQISAVSGKRASEIISNIDKKTEELGNNAKVAGNKLKEGFDLRGRLQEAADGLEKFKDKAKYFLSLTNGVQLLKRAIRSAFETIKELDAAMTETAVVTDFTVGDMWNQLPEYTKRANELGVTIKDVYEASTLYYQQGLNTNEVMQLTNATLRMARIAGLEAAEATDRMTNALRGFNMELNEANADRVADVYSKLAAISASDVDEISTAMTKVASLANSANMEFETTAAFLSQIIETTRESAETAGTALKTVVARFSEVKKLYTEGELLGKDEEGEDINVNKVSAALRTAGIDMNEYFTGGKGLDDIFMELAEKWDSLDQVQQRYIATMAAGSRQQSRFIALMQDYGRTQELVGAAYRANGASAEQYGKTMESLQTKLNQLKNNWDTFLMGITNSDLVKFFVDALSGILEFINNINSGTEGLGKTFLELAEIITLVFGGKGLLKVFDTVSGGLLKIGAAGGVAAAGEEAAGLGAKAATPPMATFGAVAKKALGWISVGIAVVGAIVGVISYFVNKTKDANSELKQTETALKNTTEAAEKATEDYNNLKNGLTRVAEEQKKFNDIQDKTSKEARESAAILNEQITSLLRDYPELVNYVELENGQLKLKDGWQDLINKKLQEEQILQASLLELETKRNQLTAEKEAKETQNKINSEVGELWVPGNKYIVDADGNWIADNSKANEVLSKMNNRLSDEEFKNFSLAWSGDASTLEKLGLTATDISGENAAANILTKILSQRSEISSILEETGGTLQLSPSLIEKFTDVVEENNSAILTYANSIKDYEKNQQRILEQQSVQISNRFLKEDLGRGNIIAEALKSNLVNMDQVSDEYAKQILEITDSAWEKYSEDEKIQARSKAAQTANVQFAEGLDEALKTLNISADTLIGASEGKLESIAVALEQMTDLSYKEVLEYLKKTIKGLPTAAEKAIIDGEKELEKVNSFKDVIDHIFGEEKGNTKISQEQFDQLPDEFKQYFEKLFGEDNYILKGIDPKAFGDKLVDWLNVGLKQAVDADVDGAEFAQYYIDAIQGNFENINFNSGAGEAVARQLLESFGATNEAIEQILNSIDVSGAIKAYKELNEQGFDTKAIEEYTKYLQQQNDKLKDNYSLALKVATANTKLHSGFKKLVDTGDDWYKLFGEDNLVPDVMSSEQQKIFNQFVQDFSEMMDISPEEAEKFIREVPGGIDAIKKAVEGADGGLENLIKKLALGDSVKEELSAAGVDISAFVDWVNSLELQDLEAGASLDGTPWMDELNAIMKATGYTFDQIAPLLEALGFKVEHVPVQVPVLSTNQFDVGFSDDEGTYVIGVETKYIDRIVFDKDFGSFSSTYTPPSTGGSGGGGSSSEEKPTYWENPYDELYNLNANINEQIRERTRLERKYQEILERGKGNLNEVKEAYAAQVAQIQKQLALEEEMRKGRERQLLNVENMLYRDDEGTQKSFKDWGVTEYAWYDAQLGAVQIDYDKIQEIANDPTKAWLGPILEKYIDYLQEYEGLMEDSEDKIDGFKDNLKDLEQAWINANIDFENRVLEALVNERQKEIDTLSAINDSITESTSKMLDSMQDSIAQERQQRSNEKTEQDIADKEARLAYLRMDTSGANAGQIKQLEKEIEDARQSYEDSLVDQAIQQMRDDADKAAEQRAKQIDIMQSQLNWEKENGKLWDQVHSLMEGAWNTKDGGSFDVNSDLAKLLQETEGFEALSEFGKDEWWKDFYKGLAATIKGETLPDKKPGSGNNEGSGNGNGSGNGSGGNEGSNEPKTEEREITDDVKERVAAAIWGSGTWGSGDERKKRLTEVFGAGAASDIQDLVNKGYSYFENKNIRWNGYGYEDVKKIKWKKYATGGLADFTGPAWLDGTKSSPELVLNADDTKNFISLKNILASLFNNNPFNTQGATAGDAYFDIDINVDELANDYDVDQLVDRVKQQIYDNSMYRNVNTLNFMR